jgi:hypothetical protein
MKHRLINFVFALVYLVVIITIWLDVTFWRPN